MNRTLYPSMAVGYYQLDAFHAPVFQFVKESRPESFAFVICNAGTENLAISVVADSRDYEQCFCYIFSAIMDFEMACIDIDVGDWMLNRPLKELANFFIQFFRNARALITIYRKLATLPESTKSFGSA